MDLRTQLLLFETLDANDKKKSTWLTSEALNTTRKYAKFDCCSVFINFSGAGN